MEKRPAIMALLIASFVLVAPTLALALDVNQKTPCSVAIKAWDTSDLDAARDIVQFIENTMENIDSNHTDNGELGIMAGMNDQARLSAVAAAIGFCRQYPKATIYNEAASAYQALREIEMQFGTAK